MASEQTPQGLFEYGPYVQVAALVERVLREADGVITLVRLIDVINHQERGPAPPADMPEIRFPLTLMISLKPGRARGRHAISITPEMPSGETMASHSVDIQLEGENRGVNLGFPLDIPYKLEGLYWFIIKYDEMVLTRVPLQVHYARLVTGTETPPPTD